MDWEETVDCSRGGVQFFGMRELRCEESNSRAEGSLLCGKRALGQEVLRAEQCQKRLAHTREALYPHHEL